MTDVRIPTELLRAVKEDIAAVRPLASPGRRLLAMLPLAMALLLLPPLYWGWRSNFAALGTVLSWATSSLESLAGLGLLWLAFRESVPGEHGATRSIHIAIALSVALFVVVTFVTGLQLPHAVPVGDWLRYARECLGMALLFALPSVALVAVLVARALPDRPLLVGAAYGLGIGLMTDAGVRLFCWISEPSHVLVSHGGAMLLSAAGGALVAVSINHARRARWRAGKRHR